MLSTVIMPYANYDDVQSLCAVYNNCLKQDADMNLLEFIGEKLLMTGFDPEENEDGRGYFLLTGGLGDGDEMVCRADPRCGLRLC